MNSSPTNQINSPPPLIKVFGGWGMGILTNQNRGRHFNEVLSNLTMDMNSGWHSWERLDTKSFRQRYGGLPVRWHTMTLLSHVQNCSQDLLPGLSCCRPLQGPPFCQLQPQVHFRGLAYNYVQIGFMHLPSTLGITSRLPGDASSSVPLKMLWSGMRWRMQRHCRLDTCVPQRTSMGSARTAEQVL